MDAHLAAAVSVGLAEKHLQLRRAVRGEHQRRFKGQLLHGLAARHATCRKHELEQRRAGYHDGLEHDVIGEPCMGVEREPAGEQPPLAARDLHRRTQQRVIGHAHPHAARIAHTSPQVKPVALPLERVSRQRDPLRAAAREEPTPVDRGTRHPRLRQRLREPLRATLLTPQRAQHRDTALHTHVLERLFHRDPQHRVRTHLDERTRIQRERSHRVLEPHPLTQTPIPVPPIQLRGVKNSPVAVEKNGTPHDTGSIPTSASTS